MTAYYACTAELNLYKPMPDIAVVMDGLGNPDEWAYDAQAVLDFADDEMLWMDIQLAEQNAEHGFIDESDSTPKGSPSHAGHDGWNGEWTEEEICTLHEEFLKRSVHVLDDKRTSQKTKESILDWISKDECQPFSFRICAIVSGCDPEKLRDQIFDLVHRLKKRRMAA